MQSLHSFIHAVCATQLFLEAQVPQLHALILHKITEHGTSVPNKLDLEFGWIVHENWTHQEKGN